MRVIGLLALLAFVVAVPARAACDEDSIETVSEDGDLIVLTSGATFDVGSGDDVTASEWHEGDDVLVCGDTIINKDENGEQIEVTAH
jgi:hypothetical protein